MQSHKLALKSHGSQEVSRIFLVEGTNVCIILRHDTRRLEAYSSLSQVEDLDVPYDLMANTNIEKLRRTPCEIENVGELAVVDNVDNFAKATDFKEDSPEALKKTLKWSAISHLGLLSLIFLLAWFLGPSKTEVKEVVVHVQEPQKVRAPVRPVTVKPSRVKLKKHRRVVKKVVPNRVAKTSNRRTKKIGLRKKKSRARAGVGTLGALGALNSLGGAGRSKVKVRLGSASVGKSKVRGAGTGSKGSSRSVLGKALLGSSPGKGLSLGGVGQYKVLGKNGGSSGYGKSSAQGRASNYLEALEEEAIIQGGLERSQITAVINRHMGQVTYCYEKGLQKDPSLAGRVAMNFVISPKGSVTRAKVENSSVGSSRVENCIVKYLKGWRFPKPVGNVSVKVIYPFLLRRVSQG